MHLNIIIVLSIWLQLWMWQSTWLAFTVIKLGSYSERKRENPQIIYPEIGRPGNDSLHWKKNKKTACITIGNMLSYVPIQHLLEIPNKKEKAIKKTKSNFLWVSENGSFEILKKVTSSNINHQYFSTITELSRVSFSRDILWLSALNNIQKYIFRVFIKEFLSNKLSTNVTKWMCCIKYCDWQHIVDKKFSTIQKQVRQWSQSEWLPHCNCLTAWYKMPQNCWHLPFLRESLLKEGEKMTLQVFACTLEH